MGCCSSKAEQTLEGSAKCTGNYDPDSGNSTHSSYATARSRPSCSYSEAPTVRADSLESRYLSLFIDATPHPRTVPPRNMTRSWRYTTKNPPMPKTMSLPNLTSGNVVVLNLSACSLDSIAAPMKLERRTRRRN